MIEKKMLLWLDDIRNPFSGDWLKRFASSFDKKQVIWVKDYQAFCNWIIENGLPSKVAFDHDLGEGSKSGYDAAKWLVNYCQDNQLKLPEWCIQSANPVGRENIDALLSNYVKFVEKYY